MGWQDAPVVDDAPPPSQPAMPGLPDAPNQLAPQPDTMPASSAGVSYYGDSIARGAQDASGAPGAAHGGWTPDQVLGAFVGAKSQDTAVISSGITNSTDPQKRRNWQEDIGLVPRQIAAARSAGANNVVLYGVGAGVRDHQQINARLAQVAAENGAQFLPFPKDAGGGWHPYGGTPEGYKKFADYTQSNIRGNVPATMQPVSPPGGPLRIDIPGKPTTMPAPAPQEASANDPLNVIELYESRGANVPNYRYDPKHTASGYWQITDTNWRNIAPSLGIDVSRYPTAMSAPRDVQRQVATDLYRTQGFAPWAPFNPSLARAVGWSGSGVAGWQGAPAIAADKAGVRLSDTALEEAAKHGKTAFDADPADILALLPKTEEGEGGERKRSSLSKSLAKGEAIQDLPEITGEMQPDGSLKITSYDGRHRLEELAQAGYSKVPIVIQGMKGEPKSVVGMSGVTLPFSGHFAPTARQQAAASQAHTAAAAEAGTEQPSGLFSAFGRGAMETGRLARQAVENTAGAFAGVPLGAAEAVTGAGQLLTHGAAALGVPGAQTAARGADAATQGIDAAINWLPEGRMGASVGGIAPAMATPTNWLAALPWLARIPAAAGLGAAVGAAQPVTSGDYGPQARGNALAGGFVGSVLQGAGEAIPAVANHLRGVVTPGTLTRAVSRLFGADTKNITPEMMGKVRRDTSATFQKVENANPLRVTPNLSADLIDVHRGALDIGHAGRSVVRAIEDVFSAMGKAVPRDLDTELWLSGARGDVIPAGSASALWHDGGAIDKLTSSVNPDVRQLGQRMKSSILNTFNGQLPPDQKALHSAARNTWRDMKIVDRAYRGKPGGGTIPVRQFSGEVGRRYPMSSGNNVPPIAHLGRAADELWPVGASIWPRITRDAIGGILGGALGSPGGPIGGAIGSAAGAFALDRLGQLRMARGNALAALRPSPAPMNSLRNLGQFAAPATVGVDQARR